MVLIVRKKRLGFSLAEVCVVCGILMVFLIPVFTLMSRSSSGTIRNRNEILAQMHCSNAIAFCNATKFDDDFLKVCDDVSISEGLSINLGSSKISLDIEGEDKNIFTRTKTIQDFTQDTWPYKYKLVSIKVQWLQPGERDKRSVKMTGLITE